MLERIKSSVMPGVVVLFASMVAVSVVVALLERPAPPDRDWPVPEEDEDIAWV